MQGPACEDYSTYVRYKDLPIVEAFQKLHADLQDANIREEHCLYEDTAHRIADQLLIDHLSKTLPEIKELFESLDRWYS